MSTCTCHPSSEALCLIGHFERLRRGGDSGIDYLEPSLRLKPEPEKVEE